MTQRLERTLPSSMKKYASAYVQQNLVQPSLSSGTGYSPHTPQAEPAFAHRPISASPQSSIHYNSTELPYTPAQPAAIAPEPGLIQPTTDDHLPLDTPTVEPYDFIMNPGQTKPKAALLPNLNSGLKKAVFVIVLVFIVIVVLSVGKNLLGGPSIASTFASVAQDQQAMIHITSSLSSGSKQQTLSVTSQNFAATANSSLVSSQVQLFNYLANNKQKINPKVLNLKINPTFDTQLSQSSASGTFEHTFQQIMKTELTSYMNDLNHTYEKTTGKNGRTLLVNDYTQAKLLLDQLNQASAGG